MQKSITRSSLLHPILFSIFPILFLYSQGNNILPFQDFVIPLIVTILTTLGLWFFVSYVTKNKIKSGLIVSLFVFLSLNFGHFKNLIPVEDFFVFLVFCVLLIIGAVSIIKTKRKLDKATTITNSIAVIFIVMVLIDIGTYNFEKYSIDEPDIVLNQDLKITQVHGSPDVYFLILDAYANGKVLDKFFGYSNQEFYDSLREQGFFISDKYSSSNYIETHLTVPSILNMDYIDDLIAQDISKKLKEEQLKRLAENNLVMQNFKELGYTNIGIDSGWLGARVNEIADKNFCELTIDYRVYNLLKVNSIIQSVDGMISNFNQGSDLEIANLNKVPENHYKREKVLCNISILPTISEKFDEPVFVYWHVLSPHTPWVFDENGDPPSERINTLTKDVKKRQVAYTNEMEFINNQIIGITEKLISDSEDKPIIVILSDHGTRIIDEQLVEDEKNIIAYGNFMAFYLPNDVEFRNSETTPVNTFRVIFNNYFNGQYEILENKVFDRTGEQFTDWDEKVNKVFP